MKNYRIYFVLLFALMIGGALQISAQSRAVINGLNTATKCFEEKEAAFVAAGSNTTLTGNEATIYNINQKLPILDELIGCADTAIKIKGMPLQARRNLGARRKEYVTAKETFTFQSCIFNRLDEAEKGLPAVTKRIESKDKLGAMVEIQGVRISAVRAKLCAEEGLASKTIPPDMKTGFRDNLAATVSLLEKIEDLRKTIETMPEK